MSFARNQAKSPQQEWQGKRQRNERGQDREFGPLGSGLGADPTGIGYGSEVKAGLSAVLLLRYSMTLDDTPYSS